jgi:hypothetical protein
VLPCPYRDPSATISWVGRSVRVPRWELRCKIATLAENPPRFIVPAACRHIVHRAGRLLSHWRQRWFEQVKF